MPVDNTDNGLHDQLNSSSGSIELRADAREFIPKTKHQVDRQEVNRRSAPRQKRNTGAVPKQSSSASSHDDRNGWPSRVNHNGRREGGYEERSSRGSDSADNRKFFKDNQNYPNEAKSSRNDTYFSNNRNASHKTSSRYESSRYDDYPRRDSQARSSNNKRDDYGGRRENGDRNGDKPPQKKPPPTPNKQKIRSIEPSKISQREQLIKDIENNTLECMICCEKVRDHQPTWSCSNCYHILHLNCIRTWISNSKSDLGEWRCVACQFLRKEVPKDYFCFCEKQKYPPVNRNDLAHSCGEMCGRTVNCPHPCTHSCHPGPHQKCEASVQRSCGCGKSFKTFQCSMKETFECEGVCEKTLNCGLHKCGDGCHQGECTPCSESIAMNCFCGKESKTEPCDSDNALVTKYSCDKVCDQVLSCKNHRCELKCHSQNCGGCKLSPEVVKSCPCGRVQIKDGLRTSCTDDIPLCKSLCSRALECGPLASPHVCSKTCHLGDCPPCAKSTNVKCRCGRIEEKILCKDLTSTDVRCKKKCTKFKTCGKHKCNQACCIELEHVCAQSCGRMLECKKHRCQRPCHIGNCLPCARASFDELRCECGKAVIYPPVPCGTVVPDCSNKCQRSHPCAHPVNHLCHSEEACPSCVFLTSKYCYGKHELRKTIPCNQDSFSCGMPCGKGLRCGRHKCIKKCHQNECAKASDECKQPCTVKRECGHNCNSPCHEGSCPEKACRESMEVTCSCGNLKEMKSCEQVAYENRKLQRAKLAMQMQDEDSFEMKDIYADLSKKSTKILECNNECATLDRNRRLDIAFKVENPNLINYPKFIPNYTEFIRTFYKKEPAFVKMVHAQLTDLVKLAKDSKQKSRSFSFPVMNRDKRHAVHDLAAMFGVETQAYDAEPNRNVVATASRESCWLPSMSLTEVLQRETGLRQVRPPTMATMHPKK